MMNKTWVLVADSHRARCFERHPDNHALTELADFVYPKYQPSNDPGVGDLTGAAGKGHGRTAHAGTQFEPKTEDRAKDRLSFARILADYINAGVTEQRCNAIVLIASSPMLGELKPLLSIAAGKALRNCIPSNMTHYQGPELKQRIDHALRLPD
jgi:protein required for attachment to host cells